MKKKRITPSSTPNIWCYWSSRDFFFDCLSFTTLYLWVSSSCDWTIFSSILKTFPITHYNPFRRLNFIVLALVILLAMFFIPDPSVNCERIPILPNTWRTQKGRDGTSILCQVISSGRFLSYEDPILWKRVHRAKAGNLCG